MRGARILGLLMVSCLIGAPALAQIEKPTDSELDAAPPQFHALLHGKSQLITRIAPPSNGPPPGMAPVAKIKNPSRDPRDFTGYWSGGQMLGNNLPGGGAPIPVAQLPPGVIGSTVIDANRLCFVNLGPAITDARIYQDKTKLTLVYDNELRARRIYFASQHPAGITPTYNGDSIAHWEGNTLVVDTIAIKGIISGIDADLEKGTHHLVIATPNLHVVERITKSADGSTLTDDATWTDSSVRPAPFHTVSTLSYTTDPLGYDSECEDIGDKFGPNYAARAK